MHRVIHASLAGLLMVAAVAQAKLPPLSDEAKAKAAETAAKTAWTDKAGAYQLCQVMNRVAEQYHKGHKDAPAAVDTPPCTDPGPFVPPAPTPPLEAAGAHSPAATATAPPSSKATAAEIQGKAKK